MTHAYKPKWSDFAAISGGPILPLTENQKTIPVSGVLPSGESGLLDDVQSRKVRGESPQHVNSGINVPYPYPNLTTAREYAYTSDDNTVGKFSDAWWEASGIIKTYPADDGLLVDRNRQSGILHYNGPSGRFSNGEQVKSNQVMDFTLFNNYIHHELMPSNATNGEAIEIPYVSTFRPYIDWNPYKRIIRS